MTIRQNNLCPCDNACKQKREQAVNYILKMGTSTAVELRNFLKGKLGIYAIRGSIEYLSSGQCKLVSVYGFSGNSKLPQFGRRGRLFYRRSLEEKQLHSVMIGLLTALQKRILDKFTKLNRRIYYFSDYDLRRLVPASGNQVEYSFGRLVKLGLLYKTRLGETDFYVKPENLLRLQAQEKQAIVEDKVEYKVIKSVHELIMNLYPAGMISGFDDRIRPHTQDVLAITGGMAFDIFYQFFEPVANREYLVVDVYTRIPVTGYTVHSFLKKIEWARTVRRKSTTNYLKGKTFGIIVYRNATRNAIKVANKRGVRFLRLTDLKIEYKQLLEKVESEMP